MTLDVLAHILMGLATLLVAGVIFAETTRRISSSAASLWIGCSMVGASILYFLILSDLALLKNFPTAWQHIAPSHKQHFAIDASWLLAGALMIWYHSERKAALVIRCVAMLAVGIILFIHVQPADLSHADWLSPYHKAIAGLLFLGALLCLQELLSGTRNGFAVAALLALVGIMLVSYQNPLQTGANHALHLKMPEMHR